MARKAAIEIFVDGGFDSIVDALAERVSDFHLLAGYAQGHDEKRLDLTWSEIW
jgi:hypothetical protein